MTARKGRILLLDCGHHVALPRAVDATCHECEVGTDRGDDRYLAGYRAGLSAQLGITIDDLERLADVWLQGARTKLGHHDGCQCGACSTSRRIRHLVARTLAEVEADDGG